MYKIIRLISVLIRQFCLPNQFTNLCEYSNVATIANWICGGIFVPLAYILTGTWYDGNEQFVWSLGFLVNYVLLTSLFMLITKFITNLYLAAFLFIVAYIILCIVENKLFGEKHRF